MKKIILSICLLATTSNICLTAGDTVEMIWQNMFRVPNFDSSYANNHTVFFWTPLTVQ